MHDMKTGALIRASVILGALAGDCRDEKMIAALGAFGEQAGLCFQIRDDILDSEADTSILGKPQGSDLRRGVPTYVSLLGMEGARLEAEQARTAAMDAITGLGERAAPLRDLAEYLLTRSH